MTPLVSRSASGTPEGRCQVVAALGAVRHHDPVEGGTAVDEVRYLLLGPMEVIVDGEPARLPGPAERALLAQLLLAPRRTVPATALVDRLWSGSSLPVDPVNALQIRVSKLRRALASLGLGDLVVRHGTGYRADVEPVSVDVVAFSARVGRARAAAAGLLHPGEEHLTRYDEALGLWRGEPLIDFANEPWAAVEAGRLTEPTWPPSPSGPRSPSVSAGRWRSSPTSSRSSPPTRRWSRSPGC